MTPAALIVMMEKPQDQHGRSVNHCSPHLNDEHWLTTVTGQTATLQAILNAGARKQHTPVPNIHQCQAGAGGAFDASAHAHTQLRISP